MKNDVDDRIRLLCRQLLQSRPDKEMDLVALRERNRARGLDMQQVFATLYGRNPQEKDTAASTLQHIASRVADVANSITASFRLTFESLMGGLQRIAVLGGSAKENDVEKTPQAVEICGWQSEGEHLRVKIAWNGDVPPSEKPELVVLSGSDALTARWIFFKQKEGQSVGIAEIDWNGPAPNLESIRDVSGDILVIQWSAPEQTLVLEFRL